MSEYCPEPHESHVWGESDAMNFPGLHAAVGCGVGTAVGAGVGLGVGVSTHFVLPSTPSVHRPAPQAWQVAYARMSWNLPGGQ